MKNILSKEEYCKLSSLFSIMGGETRLKIIWCLRDGERSVGEIAEQVEMTLSSVSHQLKELKNNDIVNVTKSGQTANYRLKDKHILEIVSLGVEHIKKENCD